MEGGGGQRGPQPEEVVTLEVVQKTVLEGCQGWPEVEKKEYSAGDTSPSAELAVVEHGLVMVVQRCYHRTLAIGKLRQW